MSGFRPPSGGGSASGLPDSFETAAANLDAADATFSYTGDDLTQIVYASGIIKTFGHGANGLETVTLSGTLPAGIQQVKTLTYTDGELTSISYS